MLVHRMLLTHAWAFLDMLHLVSSPQMWHIKSTFDLLLLFFAVGFIARFSVKTNSPVTDIHYFDSPVSKAGDRNHSLAQ